MKTVRRLEQKNWFCAIKIVVDLVLAYIFFSFAIDKGSIWLYLLTVIALGSAIRYVILIVKSYGKR